jgi:hypothetical protein
MPDMLTTIGQSGTEAELGDELYAAGTL